MVPDTCTGRRVVVGYSWARACSSSSRAGVGSDQEYTEVAVRGATSVLGNVGMGIIVVAGLGVAT